MFRFEPSNRLKIHCVASSKYPPAEGIVIDVEDIQNYPVSTTTPSTGDAFMFQNGEWNVVTYPAEQIYFYGTETDTIASTSTTFTKSVAYASAFATTPVLIVNTSGDSSFYSRTTSAQIKIVNETSTGFDVEITGISIPSQYVAFSGVSLSMAYELSDNSVVVADFGTPPGLFFRRSDTTPSAPQTWTQYQNNTFSTTSDASAFVTDSTGTFVYTFGHSSDVSLRYPGIGRYNTSTSTFTEYEPNLSTTPGRTQIYYSKYSALRRPDGSFVFVWYQRTGANTFQNVFYTVSNTSGTSWSDATLYFNSSVGEGPYSAQVTFGGTTYTAIGYERSNSGVNFEIRISTGNWPSSSVIRTPTASFGNDHNMFYFDRLTAPKLAFLRSNTLISVSSDPLGTTFVSYAWSLSPASGTNRLGEFDEWPDGRLFIVYYNVAANRMRYSEINKTTWAIENTVDLFTPTALPNYKAVTNFINSSGNLVVVYWSSASGNTYYYEQTQPSSLKIDYVAAEP